MKSIRRLGWGTTAGAGMLTALSMMGACSDSFDNAGCKATRTCEPANEGGAAGAEPVGSEPDETEGGAPGSVGGGGEAGTPPECVAASDCDNGSAVDGLETCAEGRCVAGNAPPAVVSVAPEDQSVGVEPDGTVVIEMSEELDETTVTAANVTLLDGDRAIAGTLAYADGVITFTPEKQLPLLAKLTVSVSTNVTDVEGASLLAPFTSELTVRDGAWSTSIATVATGRLADVARNLQLDDDDRALVAWNVAGDNPCPATGAWYQRGSLLTAARAFTYTRTDYCRGPITALSPNGLALISWHEEDPQSHGIGISSYRDGKWSSAIELNKRYDLPNAAVAVAGDGVMHFVGGGSDTQAWTTTPDGKWPKAGFELSPRGAMGEVHLAVAPNGDAVAAWADQLPDASRQVMAARYSATEQAWTPAQALPGSLTSDALRGQPQVAFGKNNEPFVIWQRAAQIVASRFLVDQDQWSGLSVVSGDATVPPPAIYSYEAPSLAFDGTTMVAAYPSGKEWIPHVSRYDVEEDVWTPSEGLSDTAVWVSRPPRLHADHHGNLLVVWATLTDTTDTFQLVSQRYDAGTGEWSGPSAIVGALFANPDFRSGLGDFLLAGNPRGAAVLTFSDGVSERPNHLRLVSFD